MFANQLIIVFLHCVVNCEPWTLRDFSPWPAIYHSDAFTYLESTEPEAEADVVQKGTESVVTGLLGHWVAVSVRIILSCTVLQMTHYLRHVHCCWWQGQAWPLLGLASLSLLSLMQTHLIIQQPALVLVIKTFVLVIKTCTSYANMKCRCHSCLCVSTSIWTNCPNIHPSIHPSWIYAIASSAFRMTRLLQAILAVLGWRRSYS